MRDEDRLLPWFYRALQSAIVDAYCRRSIEQAHVVAADVPEAAAEPEDSELCACFERLIPTQKSEYAELIRAVELGNEPPTDTAARLGITSNNLKVRRHRLGLARRHTPPSAARTMLCSRGRASAACAKCLNMGSRHAPAA